MESQCLNSLDNIKSNILSNGTNKENNQNDIECEYHSELDSDTVIYYTQIECRKIFDITYKRILRSNKKFTSS